MKLLKKTSLVVMLIALCTCAHVASAAPVISVELVSTEVTQGDIFEVDIMIDPSGSEVYSAQFDLSFDNTLLNGVDKCKKGTFLSDGVSTIVYVNEINNTIGMVEYTEVRNEGENGTTASGILATIKFNATGSGVCSLNLDNVILLDSKPQEIPDVLVNDGTCEILAAEHTLSPSPTPTATATTTALSTPMSPAPVTTATAVQTDTDLIPPLPGPHITETQSTGPVETQAHTSEENTPQSGFTSPIAIIGMLIVLYVILRKN